MRWGQGSLQEIDHVPFVAPVTKSGPHGRPPPHIAGLVDEALRVALEPPSGPTFVDFPLDQVFMEAEVDGDGPGSAARSGAPPRPTAPPSSAPPTCCGAPSAP